MNKTTNFNNTNLSAYESSLAINEKCDYIPEIKCQFLPNEQYNSDNMHALP
jgi:hypothetical protein